MSGAIRVAADAAVDLLAEAIAAAPCHSHFHLYNGPGRSATEQPGLLEGVAQYSTSSGMFAAGQVRLFWAR